MKIPRIHWIIFNLSKWLAGQVFFRIFPCRFGVLQQYRPRDFHDTAPAPLRLVGTGDKAIPVPGIAVVTPSFNQAAFLQRTIDSVVAHQNMPEQYVVQDNCSTDGSVEILRAHSEQFHHWDSSRDAGQSDAINKGFCHTDAPIMAWLNSDDIYLPGALDYVSSYFAQHPEVDLVYSHRIIIDEHDKEIGRWILPPHDPDILRQVDYVPQETMFWRRSLWERVGAAVDTDFHFAMDWELLLRFQEAGATIVRLDCFLAAFRHHSSQKTVTNADDTGAREINNLRQRVLGYVPTSRELAVAIDPYLRNQAKAQMRWRFKKWLHGTNGRG